MMIWFYPLFTVTSAKAEYFGVLSLIWTEIKKYIGFQDGCTINKWVFSTNHTESSVYKIEKSFTNPRTAINHYGQTL